MYYLLLIFLIILSLFLLFFGISTLFSIYGGIVYVNSGKRIFEAAQKEAGIKPGEKYYELGSGFGDGLIYASERYKTKAIGFEISPLHYIISKLRIVGRKNITVQLADFRHSSFTDADVVYCYLSPQLMKDLSVKFNKELKSGARVLSLAFKIPDKKSQRIIKIGKNKLYFYMY